MANWLQKLGHAFGVPESDYDKRYNEMMEGATPLWSGPEDYAAWREKTLQNKQPWGMVPFAERQLAHEPDEYDEWYKTDWIENKDITKPGGVRSSGIYTDPRNAGLEGLFAENPELNWQNPSNKMFPWEPNYAAIEMGDRWMEDKMKGEQEMAKRMGIFDASSYYGDKTDPALAANWGGDTISTNVDLLKEKAEEGGFDWQNYFDYGILPHELGHELPRHENITNMLPYELPKGGINPMVPEKKVKGVDEYGRERNYTVPNYEDRPEGWEHDIVYNRDPIWWKYHGSRPRTDPSGVVWNNLNQQFALGDKSAMNQMALQSIARASVTGADMPSKESFWNRESYTPPWVNEYRGTPGEQYNVGAERAGPVRDTYQRAAPTQVFNTPVPDRTQGPRRHHFNTGGIVSLML